MLPRKLYQRKRRKKKSSRPLRPEFLLLRNNRRELIHRTQHYIHDYAKILNKLKFRERVVRELLRTPGGPAVTDWKDHRHVLTVLREKRNKRGIKLKGKELRLMQQYDLMNGHQQELDECQLIYFAFQFEVHGRAVVHIQKIWRACVTRPPFYIMRYKSRLALASAVLTYHKIPWLQPNIKKRIARYKHQVYLKERKASFVISFTMKRHLRIMKTLRYIHPLLDQKIIEHKLRIKSSKTIQQWWGGCTEKAAILKKALAYSANLREAQAEKERSVGEQKKHEAAKILQEWINHIIILKHNYVRKIFCALHQTMRDRIQKIDLTDTYQSNQLLGRLMDEDVEKQTQQHLAHVMKLQHVVGTKTAKSRARGRARIEEEGYVTPHHSTSSKHSMGPEESIVLDANEFDANAPVPPTVLPYTGLFPNLNPDHLLTTDELSGGTWNFWLGIERLNKNLWLPELVREDSELQVMAQSLITWYIGENEPIVQQLSVGKALSKHKYLTPLKRMYKQGALLPGGGTSNSVVSNNALNHFIWFAPELLCPNCNAFLEGSILPAGECGECGLPPHYTRNDRKTTRMGNRYHCTESYVSLRLGIDLFVIHAMFRSIALRSHYAGHGRAVPMYEAWNMAIAESKAILSKLLQYGCTKLEHLPHVPLTSIGVPGKTVLLLRNMLWHLNAELKRAHRNSPYEFTMRPPPSRELQRLALLEMNTVGHGGGKGQQGKGKGKGRPARPNTAPMKQQSKRNNKLKRPRTSGGIRRRQSGTHKKKGGNKTKKKRPSTSPVKKRGGRRRSTAARLNLPEIILDNNNPALLEGWVDAVMTPPKCYRRPKTAPNWSLSGGLVVERR